MTLRFSKLEILSLIEFFSHDSPERVYRTVQVIFKEETQKQLTEALRVPFSPSWREDEIYRTLEEEGKECRQEER